MCRVAFNHVKILLEGRLLMPWFKYIFRILELEETLRVFFLLPLGENTFQNTVFEAGWTCFQMPDTSIIRLSKLLFKRTL